VLPGIGFQLPCLGGRQNVCRADFPSGQSVSDPNSGAGCTGIVFAERSGAPSQGDWDFRINGRAPGGEKLVSVQPRNVLEVRCAGDTWKVCAEGSGGAGLAAWPPGKHCLRKRREKLTEPDFTLLARAFDWARALDPFYLKAWGFLPDPSAGGFCICAPVHPATTSLAMKKGRGAALPLLRARSTIAGARRANCGNPSSSTAPCAPSLNTTRRWSTSTLTQSSPGWLAARKIGAGRATTSTPV